MKKVIIDGKEYWQQEECDIPKISMPYPQDLLKNNQPERSKREDLNCNCHRCFQDNLLKNYYPWLYEQEMKAREGKILCQKIQDAVL